MPKNKKTFMTETVFVRMEKDLKKRIETLAGTLHMNMSSCIRIMLIGYLNDRAPQIKNLLKG